jgi:hypothetical protein
MPWRFGVDPQYSLFLAKSGWAVFEKASLRVVEIDGVPQIGLKFGPAERAATLLNTFKETPDQDWKPRLAKRTLGTSH